MFEQTRGWGDTAKTRGTVVRPNNVYGRYSAQTERDSMNQLALGLHGV